MGKTKRRRSISHHGTKLACECYGIKKDNKKNLNEQEFYDTYDDGLMSNSEYGKRASSCLTNLGYGMWGEIHNRTYQCRKARHLEKKSLRNSYKNEARQLINECLTSDENYEEVY